MRISDWSSDVCSSDLPAVLISYPLPPDNSPDTPALSVLDAILSKGESSRLYHDLVYRDPPAQSAETYPDPTQQGRALAIRSEEHTSELQSLMRPPYAVYCSTHKTSPLPTLPRSP